MAWSTVLQLICRLQQGDLPHNGAQLTLTSSAGTNPSWDGELMQLSNGSDSLRGKLELDAQPVKRGDVGHCNQCGRWREVLEYRLQLPQGFPYLQVVVVGSVWPHDVHPRYLTG